MNTGHDDLATLARIYNGQDWNLPRTTRAGSQPDPATVPTSFKEP